MFLVIGMICSWGVLSVYVRQYFNLVGDKLEQRADEHGVPDLICDVLPRYKRRAADQDAHRFAPKQPRELPGHLHITSIAGLCTKFYAFLLFYGVLLGFFCGLAYVPSLYLCYQYFPQQRGLISGICMMRLGFSAVVIQTIMVTIINPEDSPMDATELY